MITLLGTTYIYEQCDCCPEHKWWRREGSAHVCFQCWHGFDTASTLTTSAFTITNTSSTFIRAGV